MAAASWWAVGEEVEKWRGLPWLLRDVNLHGGRSIAVHDKVSMTTCLRVGVDLLSSKTTGLPFELSTGGLTKHELAP